MISKRKQEDLAFIARLMGDEKDIEEQRQAMNKIFGRPEEDPKDKRIRELEAENADLKRELAGEMERY